MRSFIAIELPEKARQSLAELQQELRKSGADVRWVRPENIHLTLKFLGAVEEKNIERVTGLIKGICKMFGPFHLEIGEIGLFPNERSPRVIWVGIDGSTVLRSLQNEIESVLIPLGFEREQRKFTPHITLGRVRSSQGKRSLKEFVESFRESTCGKLDVRSVSFMRSDLRPAGAVYTRIAEIPLQDSGM